MKKILFRHNALVEVVLPQPSCAILPDSLGDDPAGLGSSAGGIAAAAVLGLLDAEGGPNDLLTAVAGITGDEVGVVLQDVHIGELLGLDQLGADVQDQGSFVFAGMAAAAPGGSADLVELLGEEGNGSSAGVVVWSMWKRSSSRAKFSKNR
jgi:hypothetical protein